MTTGIPLLDTFIIFLVVITNIAVALKIYEMNSNIAKITKYIDEHMKKE